MNAVAEPRNVREMREALETAKLPPHILTDNDRSSVRIMRADADELVVSFWHPCDQERELFWGIGFSATLVPARPPGDDEFTWMGSTHMWLGTWPTILARVRHFLISSQP